MIGCGRLAWGIGVAAVVAAAGCRSVRQATSSGPALRPSYERQELKNSLKDLVVRLNLRDCPEQQVFRYTSWYGIERTEKPHALIDLVRDEFGSVISSNFTSVEDARPRMAKVELNVTPNRIELFDPYIGNARCLYSFAVKLLDPRSNDVKPFFEKTICAESESQIDDGKIPDCEYAAIQEIAVKFLSAVVSDREVIRLLEERNQEQPPEISDWQPRHLACGALRGNAYASCNDWNKDASRTWAKRQIFKRAANELRLPEVMDEVRVFYFRESYDETSGRWNFEFDVLPREPLVIVPRNERNWATGRCYIDVKLLKAKEGSQAMKIAKNRILEKVCAEGCDGVSVELKNPLRHTLHTDVIVAEYAVK